MLDFSEKQEAFLHYLMSKLGFEESDFKTQYIDSLSEIAFIHKGLAAIDEDNWDYENEKPYYYYDSGKYLPERFNIIDFLVQEYRYKKNNEFKTLINKTNYISATDLANYTYCPIGYSIGCTYETPKNYLAEIGTSKHEEHRLINAFKPTEEKTEFESKKDFLLYYQNNETKEFISDIESSKVVFSGHDKNIKEKYFINENKGFIGQPDYIFINNENKYFIVEEKFKRNKESNQNFFFRNHKVQLAAYIYYIEKYKIDYGYLVYWLYEYSGTSVSIEKCKVLKISRTQSAEDYLDNAFNEVLSFKTKKYININISVLNPKKCANCVYVLLCGHKNKRRNQVTIPYQSSYFSLYYAKYPEILKKEMDDDEKN
jgi:CRISPR/Cas system-associated exonuclease Cas4 (RecB family)